MKGVFVDENLWINVANVDSSHFERLEMDELDDLGLGGAVGYLLAKFFPCRGGCKGFEEGRGWN